MRLMSLSALSLAISSINIEMSNAAPQGGNVTSGAATINTAFDNETAISTTTITTTSAGSGVDVDISVNWDSFNVGSDEAVHFAQPTNSSIAVNNIGGNSVSKIQGSITSNGQVFLSNPNGFLFSSGSSVNTGSFLATTSNMSLSNGELTLAAPEDTSVTLEDGSVVEASIIFQAESSVTTASFNENKQESFIAIFSPNITNSGTLTAQDSSVFLSTKNQGTIKLQGLDIGIDISGLTASNLDANLSVPTSGLSTGNSSANTNNYVLLTSSDLSTIIQSAIKSPSSMSEINFSNHLNDYNIDVHGENLALSGNAIIYNGDSESTLTFTDTSTEGLEILSSIQGSNLNLNLNAQDITIGSANSSVSLGGGEGGSGLKSINIDTSSNTSGNGSTTIHSGMKAIQNININSELIYAGNDSSNEIVFNTIDSDGAISFSKALESSAPNDTIILETNTLNLAGITGFDTVEFDASNIIFNTSNKGNDAYITANTISTRGESDLYLNGDITLSSSVIDLSGVNMASYYDSSDATGEAGYSLTLNSNESNGQFKLNNLSDSVNIDTNDELTHIEDLIIEGSADNTSNVFISGELTAERFMANIENTGTVEMTLTDNLTLNSVNELDTKNVSINGNHTLDINGSNTTDSIANIGSISNSSSLTGLSAVGFSKLYLHNDINVSAGNISLSATDIFINKSEALNTQEALLIENTGNGTISLNGHTQTDENTPSSLTITTFNGDIAVNQVTGLDNFSITKSLSTEGNISLQGDINVNQHIALNDLGDVNIGNDITFTANTFDSTQSHLVNPSHHLSIVTSDHANLGSISAQNISVTNKMETAPEELTQSNLHGDITATDSLNFVGTSINLESNLSLSGNINFLDLASTDSKNKPSINGTYNLYLNATNENIYIYDFGNTTSLNSLSVEGTGNIYFTSMPIIQGSGGLSLLGKLELDVEDGHEFNYDGDINFEGANINGSGELTFTSASGDISLGDVGVDSDITSLVINSSGKLNLHGDINLVKPNYDFSNLSAIEIHQNMTFGSAETPALVNFGDATIDGTYSLTIYSDQPTFGIIGSNIALQDLNIYSSGALNLTHDITLVGSANINADTILLDSNITTTGLNINLASEGDMTMSSVAALNANFGNISLSSNSGNISIGTLSAFELVDINAQAGSVFNSIDDYISNTNTSVNITSENQSIYASNQIGSGVGSPIVIDAQNNGEITLESNGSIYIANLSNAEVTSRSTVIDSGTANDSASVDAHSLFKLYSLNKVTEPTLETNSELISNLEWQVDEEESVKKIKTPTTVPPIYHSRKGWRLGHQ